MQYSSRSLKHDIPSLSAGRPLLLPTFFCASAVRQVNATYPFPSVLALQALLTDHGYVLKERLATHARLWHWMPTVLQERVHGTDAEQWGAVVRRERRSS